ncbi:MAG TPA: FecR domain-containing protein [Rhizomicrobium sp.]|jgi:transmembrane sensor
MADHLHAEIQAEAAAWIARLHADDRNEQDEAAFKLWLAQSSDHARIFEAVTAVWDLADGISLADVDFPVTPPVKFKRRSILAGLATLTAVGATFAVWDTAFAGVYETDVGEQKHVVLSDGTQVFLDTNTKIRERFSSTVRNVDLERGRANFRVKLDLSRPFVVEAAQQRVVASATNFDVCRDAEKVSIVLLEGQATVLVGHHKRVALFRGERLVATQAAAPNIDKPNLAPLTAWQTGQAIFDSATLSEACAEMNRYTSEQIVLNDPAISRLRLSGVYRVGDNDAFARSISRLLPVAIEHYPDHIELVRDESRMSTG